MKKAQINQMFIYGASAIIIVFVVLFGTRAIDSLADDDCELQLVTFETNLKAFIDSQAVATGKVSSKQFFVPCGYDRVFFFDRSKEVLFAGFDRYPIIVDQLESSTENNVFLLKDGKVQNMLNIAHIDIKNPYYLCSNTENGRLDIVAKGIGSGIASIHQRNDLSDCTYEFGVPMELSIEDMLFTLGEIFAFNASRVNDTIVDPLAAGLKRDISYQGDSTVITITKEDGTFDYYESIPKCAIESIQEAINDGLFEFQGDDPDFEILHDDPLIMWNFEDSDSQTVQYTIKEIIEQDCLDQGFFGIGISNESDAGIDQEKIDSARERRKEAGVLPVGAVKSISFDEYHDILDSEYVELRSTLSDLDRKVRTNDTLDDSTKKEILYQSYLFSESLDGNAQEAALMFEILDDLINRTLGDSFIEEEFRNSTLHTINRKDDLARVEEISFSDDTHSFGSNWCYDGFNITDRCFNSTHVANVTYDSTKKQCIYSQRHYCDSNNVCVSGRCVSDSYNAIRGDGECIHLDPSQTFRDECKDQFTLTEFRRDSTDDVCTPVEVNCMDFGQSCHQGRCIDTIPFCDVSDDGLSCEDSKGSHTGTKCEMREGIVHYTAYSCNSDNFCVQKIYPIATPHRNFCLCNQDGDGLDCSFPGGLSEGGLSVVRKK